MKTLILSLLVTILPIGYSASTHAFDSLSSSTTVTDDSSMESVINGIHSTIIELEAYSTINEIKSYLLPIEKNCLYLKSLIATRGPSSSTMLKKVDELVIKLEAAREYFDMSYEKKAIQELLILIDTYTQELVLLRQ